MSLCVSKAVYDTIKLPNKILLYNPNINDKGFKGRKNKDKFVVAAMGSLIKIKGFEYYIKAADKVSENFLLNLDYMVKDLYMILWKHYQMVK